MTLIEKLLLKVGNLASLDRGRDQRVVGIDLVVMRGRVLELRLKRGKTLVDQVRVSLVVAGEVVRVGLVVGVLVLDGRCVVAGGNVRAGEKRGGGGRGSENIGRTSAHGRQGQ